MEANSSLQRYAMLASFFLPEGILEWFDVVRMEESDNDKPAHELDVLYPKVLHIHLDERDNRQGEDLGLVSNGFTEESVIHDYPARSRKMVLHVRRRRYKDADGHNIILCNYPLAAEGTRLSVEFGVFFKDYPG
jgi:hypothetical protein